MIFLLDRTNLAAQLLEPKLHARLPMVGLEIFSSFKAMLLRLSCMHKDSVIVILAPRQPSQLHQFGKIRKLLLDIPMVLLLPDSTLETIRLAHQLYPRFICFRNDNFDDLVEVVARMHRKLVLRTPGFELPHLLPG